MPSLLQTFGGTYSAICFSRLVTALVVEMHSASQRYSQVQIMNRLEQQHKNIVNISFIFSITILITNRWFKNENNCIRSHYKNLNIWILNIN